MTSIASRPDRGSMSLEEFGRMPEEDAFRVELSRGRVVREPRPGAEHGVIVARIVRLLGTAADVGGTGVVVTETGFLLRTDPPTVRGPDAAFIERNPADPVPRGFWREPPTLAIEVVSPSNTAAEIHEKILEYLEAGTELVWVVDPGPRSVTVWRPPGDAHVYRDRDIVATVESLKGFSVRVAEIFARG